MSKTPSVVLAGGGTAGHINPMLAIARAVRCENPEAKILTVGTKSGMEAEIVPQAGFPIEFIPRVPFPRRPNLKALKFPAQFFSSIKASQSILEEAKADVLVGVGGYVCTPMYIAAQKMGIPVVVHEANAKPGWANKVGARKATLVATAFSETQIARAELVGMPMRHDIAVLDRAANQQDARIRLGLDPTKPTLVVTGGSLGALSLNKAVEANIDSIHDWGFQVLHITGKGKQILTETGDLQSAPSYLQVEFITAMEDVYAAADLLVVRSGAATVSEVAAVGLPAIFVPLPIGNGEQAMNCKSLVASGGGLMVEDAQFTATWFAHHVPELFQDSKKLEEMAQASYTHGIRDAAEVMAHKILKVAA